MQYGNSLLLDENELARLIKNGNQLAFATIFDRYNKQLYSLAYRYLKSREMAEDAVQQVFVNIWINRTRINEKLSIRNLLFTSLRNHTLNVLRNNHRAIELNYEILMESIQIEEANEEQEDFVKMTTLIKKAADNLSPQRQQIFNLKIMQSLSNQEIANKLGISVNTVKVQYYHILKEIREYVGKKMFSYLILITCLFR